VRLQTAGSVTPEGRKAWPGPDRGERGPHRGLDGASVPPGSQSRLGEAGSDEKKSRWHARRPTIRGFPAHSNEVDENQRTGPQLMGG
jgi:hypothetical protein